jgi:hypothetical protein
MAASPWRGAVSLTVIVRIWPFNAPAHPPGQRKCMDVKCPVAKARTARSHPRHNCVTTSEAKLTALAAMASVRGARSGSVAGSTLRPLRLRRLSV